MDLKLDLSVQRSVVFSNQTLGSIKNAFAFHNLSQFSISLFLSFLCTRAHCHSTSAMNHYLIVHIIIIYSLFTYSNISVVFVDSRQQLHLPNFVHNFSARTIEYAVL